MKDSKTFLSYVQYFRVYHCKSKGELWYSVFPLWTKECVEQREAFLLICIWRFLYNTHWWRHFDIFWNIPDLIHLLILLINFLELLKWLKCRVDRGLNETHLGPKIHAQEYSVLFLSMGLPVFLRNYLPPVQWQQPWCFYVCSCVHKAVTVKV